MNTKTIARLLTLPIAVVNDAARDLRIAKYDSNCRCWRVENRKAADFVLMLSEREDADQSNIAQALALAY